MTGRVEFLNSLLGKPWLANAKGPEAFDCFHLFHYVEEHLFSIVVDEVEVPENPSWAWMIETIAAHPELKKWVEVPSTEMGIIRAGDGAGVLMARRDRPAHIGVWLFPEGRILHSDPRHGVVFERPVDLRTKGWTRLRFYERPDERAGSQATKINDGAAAIA